MNGFNFNNQNDTQHNDTALASIRINQLPVPVTTWQHGAPDMFCDFYLVKNHTISNNSTTTKARENISTDFESQNVYEFFDVGLAKFENNQILLNKMGLTFLVTTKLLTVLKTFSVLAPTVSPERSRGRVLRLSPEANVE
jgi:hypothetical protein